VRADVAARPERHAVLQARPDLGTLLPVVVIAAAWPSFVFSGNQLAFLASLIGSCLVAIKLARRRTRLVLVYFVAVASLIGTEANGAIGRGDPPLGTLRLIDGTLVVVVLWLVGSEYLRTIAPRASFRKRIRQTLALLRRSGLSISTPGWILISLVLYATALWLSNGAPIDSITKTDLRLLMLGAGLWIVARTCRVGRPGQPPLIFIALAPFLMLKALGIYATDAIAIGTYDRVQASTVFADGTHRVILIGGDTVFALVPALAIAATTVTVSRWSRLLLAVATGAALFGLILSGTRTSAVVAIGLMIFVAVALLAYGYAPRMRMVVLVGLTAIALLGAAATSGLITRLTTPDAPHVGIHFRRDEAASFFDLPRSDLVYGQGLGGRFIGKDVNGQYIETGWMHTFPLWIVLKVGVPGLIGAVLALALLLRRMIALLPSTARSDVIAGAIVTGGLAVLSMTLGRAALPEGVVVLTFGLALLSVTPSRPS
jgi:hypothetical protein